MTLDSRILPDFPFNERRFNLFLPDSKIIPISYDDLSLFSRDKFEERSAVYLDPSEFSTNNFDSLYRILHHDDLITAVATQRKKDLAGIDGKNIYICDELSSSQPVGFAELRFCSSEENFPVINWTETVKKKKGAKFNIRRLQTLNALSQSILHLPLHSHACIGFKARRSWEYLIDCGLAETYLDGKVRRYKFK